MRLSLRVKRIIRGFLKSWTTHAGTYLAVIGFLQTQDKLLTQWIGDEAIGAVMMGFGLVIVLLRAKTSESLEVKGSL